MVAGFVHPLPWAFPQGQPEDYWQVSLEIDHTTLRINSSLLRIERASTDDGPTASSTALSSITSLVTPSTTASISPGTSSHDGKNLGSGAWAGIGLGSAIFVALLILLGRYLFTRKRRQGSRRSSDLSFQCAGIPVGNDGNVIPELPASPPEKTAEPAQGFVAELGRAASFVKRSFESNKPEKPKV